MQDARMININPLLYLDLVPSALETRYRGIYIQGPAKLWSPGMVNFVSAVAYLFCLNLPAAFCRVGLQGLICQFTEKLRVEA